MPVKVILKTWHTRKDTINFEKHIAHKYCDALAASVVSDHPFISLRVSSTLGNISTNFVTLLLKSTHLVIQKRTNGHSL